MSTSDHSEQYQTEWANEPDLEKLRKAYTLLSSDRESALSQLRDLAERGSVMSMIYIGRTIGKGLKSNENHDEVLKWYEMAARSGMPYALYSYGRILQKTYRVQEAFHIFESDALSDYAPALNQLATMYRRGVVVPRDLRKAEKLYIRSAENGNLFASRGLASFYATGLGGVINIPRGIYMFLAYLPKFCREVFRAGPSSERLI